MAIVIILMAEVVGYGNRSFHYVKANIILQIEMKSLGLRKYCFSQQLHVKHIRNITVWYTYEID